MIEEYYRKVEEVLKSFPEECQKDYYENKKTVEIEKMEVDVPNITGDYDHEDNVIEYKKEEAIPHELFHMSFRDKDKVGKKLFEGNEFIYSNGIAYKYMIEDELQITGKGLTEGFAEYLSRKCCPDIGHQYLYFFTNLLISIHGEDIIYYPLKNDVKGFYEDSRFFDIFEVVRALDEVEMFVRILKRIVSDKEAIEKYLEVATHEQKLSLSKVLVNSRVGFKKSIIDAYEVIIAEFENSLNPQISKQDFIIKLTEFLNNPDYNLVFMFDKYDFSLSDKIKSIIEDFKESKQK